MKTLSLIIALLAGTFINSAQEQNSHDITITIDNVQSNHGKVLLALHTADTFMKGDGIQGKAITIEDGKVATTFKNVSPGTYAILVLHDENENNRMDYESSGMPKEAYAMSNNPILYGPPRFEDAKFELKDKNLNLNLKF